MAQNRARTLRGSEGTAVFWFPPVFAPWQFIKVALKSRRKPLDGAARMAEMSYNFQKLPTQFPTSCKKIDVTVTVSAEI